MVNEKIAKRFIILRKKKNIKKTIIFIFLEKNDKEK